MGMGTEKDVCGYVSHQAHLPHELAPSISVLIDSFEIMTAMAAIGVSPVSRLWREFPGMEGALPHELKVSSGAWFSTLTWEAHYTKPLSTGPSGHLLPSESGTQVCISIMRRGEPPSSMSQE